MVLAQPLCQLEIFQPCAVLLCKVWGGANIHSHLVGRQQGAGAPRVLTVEHVDMALHSQPFSWAFPMRHGREMQVHTVHPHQGQRARKKDKAKTNKTAPPRNVSSLDALALAFQLAFASCSSRCQEWLHPVAILAVGGLYFITFAHSPPESITWEHPVAS